MVPFRFFGLFVSLLILFLSGISLPRASSALEVSRMAGQGADSVPVSPKKISKESSDSKGKNSVSPPVSSPKGTKADLSVGGKDQKAPERKPIAPLDVTDSVRRMESLGTLSSFSEGSLGRDIWAGTGRSDLAFFFPALPSSLPSTTVTGLLRRAMLTKADSTLLVSDADVMPGEDFLTLRLEQVLRQGGYQDALDLYARVKDKPYHPRLARAGVTAMILTGNVALACLEMHSVPDGVRKDAFWKDLGDWCAVSLEPVAGDVSSKAESRKIGGILGSISTNRAYRFTLRNFRQLGTLSVLERGLLVGEGRIDYAPDFAGAVADAPADLLALPLYDKSLPPVLRIRITAECVRRGLLPVQALDDLYISLAPPNAAPSASDGKLMSLPFLFRDAQKSKTDQEKWEAVESALALQSDIGWSPLLPFAGVVRELLPGKISPETIRRVTGLVLRAGLTLPEPWGQRLDGLRESGNGRAGEAAILLDIAVCIAREDPLIRQKIHQVVDRLPFRDAQLLLAISKGMGASKGDSSEKKASYGKLNPLTGAYNYVMPSSVVYDVLMRGGESKIPGQVILSSAIALQGTEPGSSYPGVLERVLEGYESVGLHHEARRLAVEAVLGLL